MFIVEYSNADIAKEGTSMGSDQYMIPEGELIVLTGRHIKLKLKSSKQQSVDRDTLSNYERWVRQIDELLEVMVSEFNIPIFRDGKPLRKLRFLFEYLNGTKTSDDGSYRANLQLCRIKNITDSLVKIRTNDQVFRVIRKNLISEASGYSYWGFVFELLIAARLEEYGISFLASDRRGGGADFIISHEECMFFVECHSLFKDPSGVSRENITKKVERGIKKKESKSYASKNCVLLLDVTNLMDSELKLDGNLKSLIPKEFKFGSIILCCSNMSISDGVYRYGYGWVRQDSDDISSGLKITLDRSFPIQSDCISVPMDGVLAF